jgi:hypothetical protein
VISRGTLRALLAIEIIAAALFAIGARYREGLVIVLIAVPCFVLLYSGRRALRDSLMVRNGLALVTFIVLGGILLPAIAYPAGLWALGLWCGLALVAGAVVNRHAFATTAGSLRRFGLRASLTIVSAVAFVLVSLSASTHIDYL